MPLKVIRATSEHEKVKIPNSLLFDSDLSLKAKGIVCYVLSLHNVKQFSISELSDVLKDGKDGIRSGLKELEKFGYVKVQHKKSHKNVKYLRNTKEYREWRQGVLERDNYTCKICGQFRGILHVHHKKPLNEYPSLYADLENGIVLCESCHKLIHKKFCLTEKCYTG